MTRRPLIPHAGARVLLWLATSDLRLINHLDRLLKAALVRAERRTARVRAIAERLARDRQPRPSCPAGDLLHGSKAIAAHLGVSKAVTVHLIRARLIPWFALGGVACARRSTLASHFAALEAGLPPETLQGNAGRRARA